MALDELLAYLAMRPANGTWSGWNVRQVAGGQNNLVYRASNAATDLAVKWTRRDERDRAGREYASLRLLEQRGLDLAPRALLFDCESYDLPVVVQTWAHGAALHEPPSADDDWNALLCHYAAIHTIHQATGDGTIRPAVLTFTSANDGLARVRSSAARVARVAWTARQDELLCRLEEATWPAWPTPPLTLCRVDPNVSNFLRHGQQYCSVDWENSGWGDPAFEIADLLAHPAYLDLPHDRRVWIATRYAELMDTSQVFERIWTYFCLMMCDWAFFFARKAHEYAAGAPSRARLVERPSEWYATLPRQRDRYTARARDLLGAQAPARAGGAG